jgi:16S rRNA (cytidine1402-2'-O)-methyltransferase
VGGGSEVGGVLYVVATPIGNLGDVTLRAIEVLRAVPLIAAEDTRIARRLFARNGIDTRMTSFHARSGPGRLAELVGHLRSGADLAVVTDAGTPSVSDPGDDLVRAWAEAGGTVVPIPGPSAALAALVASGVAGPRWSFEGFLPRSGRVRRDRLVRIAADERATIVFEAPSRVAATLADLAATCGPDRPAAVCRELTKLHEEIVRGPLGRLAASAADGGLTLRGEFVIVVGDVAGGGRSGAGASGAAASAGQPDATERHAAARIEMRRLMAGGLARGEAARRAAALFGVPRRALYDAPDRPGGSPP